MTDLAASRSYLERSRHDRRVELARYGHERQVNMSVVMGLSFRVKGHQAHIDYTGGLDTVRIYRNLASSLGGLSWNAIASRLHVLEGRRDGLEAKTTSLETQLGSGKAHGTTTIDWRDAVAQAAPVDYQRPERYRLDGETADECRNRTRAVWERKAGYFAPVLARIDKGALANLARELVEQRRRREQQQCPENDANPVPLPVIGDPTFGSGHVFYVIRFPGDDDGGGDEGERRRIKKRDKVQWIAKIPAATSTSMSADGEEGAQGRWNKLCCETLRSEAFLLHMLRQETSIPVPEVIDADCRPDNEVGVPWLLMEYVEGRRLEDVWFARDGGRNADGNGERALKPRREAILRNVAAAMLELGKYQFDSGGALVFDKRQGELGKRTGALREMDVKAMVLRWFEDEDCSAGPLYCSTGPWERPRDMYTTFLDDWAPETLDGKGVDELLRLLIDHIREPWTWEASEEKVTRGVGDIRRTRAAKQAQTKMKKFVLMHPDLTMRNIILAEDGTTIKAILGWDGARAAPRSMGNEALPRWLVRDFNPFVWQWKADAEFRPSNRARLECNRFEDSPWVLRELRGFYASVIRDLKEERQKRGARERSVSEDVNVDNHGVIGNGNHEDFDITRQSLLTLTLDTAIRDPRCRALALRRLLEKCSRPFEELDFDYFVGALGKAYEIDACKLKYLASNMKELVDKGLVKGAVVW